FQLGECQLRVRAGPDHLALDFDAKVVREGLGHRAAVIRRDDDVVDVSGADAHQCPSLRGVANSTSTPWLDLGWRKQIIPASPRRGFSSISWMPFWRAPSSSASTSSLSKQMWCIPSPRDSRNLATPV